MDDAPEAKAPDEAAAPAPQPAPQPEPKPIKPAPTPEAIDAAIDAWLSADVRNSPISQATPAWNHLTAVLPHLAAKLKEL